MKLSEAIRLGAMLKPQGRGDLYTKTIRKRFFGLFKQTVEQSCALGGAFEAAGFKIGPPVQTGSRPIRGVGPAIGSVEVSSEWFRILEQLSKCPSCALWGPVSSVIAHLNDHHQLTREAIADFVQSVEDAQSVALPQQQEEAVQC